MSGKALASAVREALAREADSEKAEPMQAYMKSEMPFLGIPAGPRRKICRAVFRDYPLADFNAWTAGILGLWREAAYREERYAAVDLAAYPRYNRFRTPGCMPMYEEMIVSGAWWDYVDELAVRHVGLLLDQNQPAIEPIVREWSVDENMWKRGTAIICQVLRREKTDHDLLTDCMLPSLKRKEFFLRKAIGWALRQHSKTDSDWVRSFVASHSEDLSALSKREALRLMRSK